MSDYFNKYFRYIPWLVLLITLFCYFPSFQNQFLNWDDNAYITANPDIKTLNAGNTGHFFTKAYNNTYIPLTMFTWAFEYALWGMKPLGYILFNILLHLANVYLVYLMVMQWTNKRNIALLCMLLFGLHPIHVESVVWITERKDVLYSFFFFLALWQWGKYSGKRENEKSAIRFWRNKHYRLALIFFFLSLLSKGQAVIFPVIILLIDFYKNKRFAGLKFLNEKIPFFILSLFLGAIALYFQRYFSPDGKSILYHFETSEKIYLSCYALIQYFLKTVFPFHLSAAYPLPSPAEYFPSFYKWYIFPAVALLILLIIMLWKRKHTGFALGFFFFNVILILDHSSVGILVMADRFVYIGSLGLFMGIGSLVELINHYNVIWKKIIVLLLTVYLIFLGLQTTSRSAVWKNEKTLFTDAIRKYPRNPIALDVLGCYYSNNEKYDSALSFFNKAILIHPKYMTAYCDRGTAYSKSGNTEAAMQDYNKAILLHPGYAEAYNNRGVLFDKTGDKKRALQDFNKALLLHPGFSEAYYNRANIYKGFGDTKSSINDFNKAIQLDPEFSRAYFDRGNIYYETGNMESALQDYNKTIFCNPEHAEAYNNRGMAYYKSGNTEAALQDFDKAILLNHEFTEAYNNRAMVYYKSGNIDKAMEDVNKILSLEPDNADAFFNRGNFKSVLKNYKGAIDDYILSLKLKPNGIVYYTCGFSRLYLNDTTGACKDWKKAAEMGYSGALQAIREHCH